MEKLLELDGSIHHKITKRMIKPLKNVYISKIIDAGSGKTSASLMLEFFPTCSVQAVIYPGDNRKKNPLSNAITSKRLEITEADICTAEFKRKYDLCFVHLSLGEALNFGNPFESLFHHIMAIKAKYFLIVDVLEDPCVHYRYIEQWLKEKNYKVILKKIFRNPHPEHYPKVAYDKYKLEFDSKHYVAYLIRNNNIK